MLKPIYIFLVFFQLLLVTACSKNEPAPKNQSDPEEVKEEDVVIPETDWTTWSTTGEAEQRTLKPPNNAENLSVSDAHEAKIPSITSVSDIDKKVNIILFIIALIVISIAGFFYMIFRDFNKLVEFQNSQMDALTIFQNKLNELISNYTQISSKVSQGAASDGKPDDSKSTDDHRMFVKMAHNIFKLRKNMSASERDNNSGDKKNKRSIDQMVEDLEKNGYEIVDLTDTDYTTELNVNVINYVSSDSFPPGKRKITKMIKPSVKYKGKIISQGDVEVTESTNK